MTLRTARTIPDVAEQLMREFEGFLSVSTITGVVLRLGLDDGVPMADLAAKARGEMVSLVGGDPADSAER